MHQKWRQFNRINCFIAEKLRRKLPVYRRTRRKMLALLGVVGIILIPTIVYIFRQATAAKAAWWDDTWRYRTPIPITNTGNALSNYQLQIALDTSSLITDGKLRSDCGDLRFTDPAGVELSYWINDKHHTCNNAATEIWVKVNTIPVNSSTIYVYYGNAQAVVGANGSATFDYFDDFSSNTSSNYTSTHSTATVAYDANTKVLKQTDTASTQKWLVNTKYTLPNNYVFQADVYDANEVDGRQHHGIIVNADDEKPYGWRISHYWTPIYFLSRWDVNGTENFTSVADNGNYANASWITYEAQYDQTTKTLTMNYVYNGTKYAIGSNTHDFAPTGHYGLFSYGNEVWFDNVIVRQYAATPPTAGAVGTEEQGEGPVVYYSFNEGSGTTVHNNRDKTDDTDLVSYWKMDETSGTTVYDDNKKVNGTATSTSIVNGRIGKALSFNGSADVTMGNPSALQQTGSQTIMMWVYPTSLGGTRQNPWCKAYGGEGCITQEPSGQFNYYYGTAGGNASPYTAFNSGLTVTQGSWHHIAVVRDLGKMTVTWYINGRKGTTTTSPYTAAVVSSLNATIGTGYAGGYQGTIDDVQIYNRALNESEIFAAYRSLHGSVVGTGTWSDGANTGPNQKTLDRSLTFNGTSTYVSTPDQTPLDFTGNFTLSAWVSRTGTTGASQLVVAKQQTISDGGFALSIGNSGEVYCQTSDGPNFVSSYTDTNVVPVSTNWVQLTAVRSGSTCRVYVNGTDRTTNFGDHAAMTTNSTPLTIGAWGDATQYVSGKIDEVKIYNYALSDDQIKQGYNRSAGAVLGAGAKSSDPGMTNLKGWWKFDETQQTSNLAQDTSGNGNYATLTSATYYSGKYGNALSVPSSAYAYSANSSSLNINGSGSQLTVSMWVKITAYPSGWYTLFHKGSSDSASCGETSCSDRQYAMFIGNTGNLHFASTSVNNVGVTQTTLNAANGSVKPNVWHHITGTINSSSGVMKIFVDGIEVASSTGYSNTGIRSANGGLFIGTSPGGGNTFTGLIDDARVYNTALSQAQINYVMTQGNPLLHYSIDEASGATLYSTNANRHANDLVSWWKMDEGSGTSIGDDTKSNNGTATNTSWSTSGYRGNALTFSSASSSRVALGSSSNANITGDITISLWIYPTSLAAAQGIIHKDQQYSIYFDASGNFNWADSSDWSYANFGATNIGIVINQWQHLAVTKTNGVVTVYLNGVQKAQKSFGSSITSTSNVMHLGCYANATTCTGYYADALLDSVKLYNRALTAGEVAEEYTAIEGDLISGPTWTTGAATSGQKAMGTALTFNGSSQYVSVPNFTRPSQITTSAWVNVNSSLSGIGHIIGGDDSTTAPQKRSFQFSITDGSTGGVNGAARMLVFVGGSWYQAVGTTNLKGAGWHFVTGTYDGETVKIYVNGKLEGQDTSPSGSIDSGTNLAIGRASNVRNTGYYYGSIDEPKVFGYALSDQDILTEYNRGQAVVLGAGTQANNPQNTGGLIGWWKMDEEFYSQQNALDSSGNNYTGVNTGATYYEGKIGNSIQFSTSSTYLSVPHTSTLNFSRTSTYSTVAWIKTNSTGNRVYLAKIQTASPYSGWQIFVGTNGSVYYDICNVWSTDWNRIHTEKSVSDNQWHQVVTTYDGSGVGGMKIYIDGILQTTVTDAQTLTATATNTNSLMIGGNIAGGGSPFVGQVDDVKLYSRVLTAAEVAHAYNQGAPAARWSFDEKQGVLATNKQGKSASTDGLVGFWTMDQSPPLDMSGHENTLSTDGTTSLTTGTKGQSMDFQNSTDAKVYCTDAACGTDTDYLGKGMTLSMWVASNSARTVNNNWKHIAGKHYFNGFTDMGGYLLYTDTSGEVNFIVRNPNQQGNVDSGVQLTSAFSHIVGTYDGETVKIYINGQLKATTSYTGGIANTASDFIIGGAGSTAMYWDGTIDHVKLWQRALDPREVLTEYQSNEQYGYLISFPTDNSQWQTGKFNNGLLFNGSTNYMSMSSYSLANLQSVTAWIKPTTSSQSIIDLDGGTHTITVSNGTVSASGFSSPTIYVNGQANGTVTANNWNHIAITTATGFASSTSTLGLVGSSYYSGMVDELKFYTYQLTADQVKVDMNNSAAVRFQ